jgi:ribosomal protein S18 acetylase RimI-like enzyme
MDSAELGSLYFDAYDPGIAWPTALEAIDDIKRTFDGEYGALWLAASRVAFRDTELIGAVLTVHRGPWPGTPDCPFIIEVFTDRAWRRRGVAARLLRECASAVAKAGEDWVGLRVDETNQAGMALYIAMGFCRWEG